MPGVSWMRYTYNMIQQHTHTHTATESEDGHQEWVMCGVCVCVQSCERICFALFMVLWAQAS